MPEIQPFYKFLSKWTFCLLWPFWAKSAAISEFQPNLQMFITRANFHQFQKSWWVLESIFHGQQDSNLSNSSPTIFYWLFEQFIWMYVQNLLNIPFLINFFKTTIIQLKLHQIGQSQTFSESSRPVLLDYHLLGPIWCSFSGVMRRRREAMSY